MYYFYYINGDDYHGEQSDIGDIMDEFSIDLFNKKGLSLMKYYGLSKEAIDAFCCANNLKPQHEEILWKNMTPDEQVNKYVEYISKIGGVWGELLIIDPYLFPKKYDENYVCTLSAVINKSHCSAITTVTDRNNFNGDVFQAVQLAVSIEIKNVFSDDFHDRFWIANKNKGFLSGTSLNGIGRKISSISMLDPDDVKVIVNEVNAIK